MVADAALLPVLAPSLDGMRTAHPTLWGLDPTSLHDHFWAARGVQVVRQGERFGIVDGAELFLLADPRTLVLFRLRALVDLLSWLRPELLLVRVHAPNRRDYTETIVTQGSDGFVRFERQYEGTDTHLTRVAFTRDKEVALAWQTASDPRTGWRQLRRQIRRSNRETAQVAGRIYDRAVDQDIARFVRDLVAFWKNPAATIPRAREMADGVWGDPESQVERSTKVVGRVWVGAGRKLTGPTPVVGPAALWDDPEHRPVVEGIRWQELEPTEAFIRRARPRPASTLRQGSKRLFDIVFSLCALLLTLPLYPLIMLVIFLEDGRPFFFGQRRETLGGREFTCWKFRSMRRDAEEIKARLQKENRADGPQFYIEDDPRLIRAGRWLRKTNLDEIPQFWNVLRGDMSVVGPRPSPRRENQFCPPWREARLSVRAGITGLWQTQRTRRPGLDFQEWIKYDLQYVENQSWGLDLRILYETVIIVVRGMIRS